MIAVIDFDIGNINAVVSMLQRLGLKCQITTSSQVVEQADRIILPGNGAFDACMRNLRSSGLVSVLEQRVLLHRVPVLGICVGAQMLGNGSAEGKELGLGWIDMEAHRFPMLPNLRVPHMGWNQVKATFPEHPLSEGITQDSRFYFVHSYYMVPKDSDELLFQAEYGLSFAAGVVRDNIAGVQFHPEKSHRFGKQLLKSFSRWAP